MSARTSLARGLVLAVSIVAWATSDVSSISATVVEIRVRASIATIRSQRRSSTSAPSSLNEL